MEPEKKVKLEIEDVYVFEIKHGEDCGNSPDCSCLSILEDRFEEGWSIPQKQDKNGFKYSDHKKIARVLANVVSSLPSWHLIVSHSEYIEEGPNYDGVGEYRFIKFTGTRQSIEECFGLFVDPDSEGFCRECAYYIMDRGWLPLTEKTEDDPIELSNDEELDEWIAETKELAQEYV